MTTTWFSSPLALGAVLLGALPCLTGDEQADDALPRARALTDRTFAATPERLERGRRLMTVMRCALCHSDRDLDRPGAPPVEGREFAGSVLFAGERYRLVAPNITPDEETGAGAFTDDMLARAVREGVSHDGRALGFMPWSAFRSLSDEDLAAVIVALRAVSPVRNALPQTALAPQVMEFLEADALPLEQPVPERELDDPVALGTYLIQVAECMGCHTSMDTPINPGQGGGGYFAEDRRLPGDGAFSSNLTPAPSGIPYYTRELFLDVMRTGRVVARELHPAMPWVEYGRLSDEDLSAIFAALQTLRPVDHFIDNAEEPTPCAACGGEHGGGERNRVRELISIDLPADVLAEHVGAYRFDDGFVVEVQVQDGQLVLEEAGPLHAQENGEFVAPLLGMTLRFERDDEGRIVRMVSLELSPRVAQRVDQR